MPILHAQSIGVPPGPNLPAPTPQQVLQARGPLVQVTIGVYRPMAQQLVQQGITLPAPVSGVAMIDTGASVTCIDDGAAQQLNLPVVNRVNVASASHSATQQNVYPVSLDVTSWPVPLDVGGAIGAPLAAQGIVALIGRDVLQHCTLHYNGFTGEITLAI